MTRGTKGHNVFRNIKTKRKIALVLHWDQVMSFTTVAFDQSGPRWLGISDLIAEPEGPAFISYKVARRRLDRLRFVTQDPIPDIWPDPSLRPTSAIAQRLVRASYCVIDTPFLLTAGAVSFIAACDASVVSSSP